MHNLKQKSVTESFIDKNRAFNFIIDKAVKKGCNKRPDLLLNLDNYSIIIEIDENQHVLYKKEKEKERLEEIQKNLAKPLVVIRFNCDYYLDKNGIYQLGPYTYENGREILSNLCILDERIEHLNNVFNQYVNNYQPRQNIEIISLYYDETTISNKMEVYLKKRLNNGCSFYENDSRYKNVIKLGLAEQHNTNLTYYYLRNMFCDINDREKFGCNHYDLYPLIGR